KAYHMTIRDSLVGQIQRPGKRPEHVEIIVNQRPVLTPAELKAGIKSVNGRYPEGHVLRYGSNTTPGTTDMSSAIQAALNVGKNVIFDDGDYAVASALTVASLSGPMKVTGSGKIIYTGSNINTV